MSKTITNRQTIPSFRPTQGHPPYIGIPIILILAIALAYQALPYIEIGVSDTLSVLDIIDKRTVLFLNFQGSAAMDAFFYGYSQKLTWLPLMIAATASVIAFHPGSAKDKMIFALSIAALILLSDQMSSGVIKPLASRLRPSHDPSVCSLLHYVNGYLGGMHGFVSNHAANNVCIATLLYHTFKDRLTRLTLVIYAVLMCYSRVYLGVHYPGDVLCGALLGWAIAYFAIKLCGSRMKAYSTTKRPTAILLVFYATLTFLMM